MVFALYTISQKIGHSFIMTNFSMLKYRKMMRDEVTKNVTIESF